MVRNEIPAVTVYVKIINFVLFVGQVGATRTEKLQSAAMAHWPADCSLIY